MNTSQYRHNKLLHFRRLHKLSQNEVLNMLGTKNKNLLTEWENGDTFPSMINLFKLSIIYKTLPHNFYPELYEALREYLRPLIISKRYPNER